MPTTVNPFASRYRLEPLLVLLAGWVIIGPQPVLRPAGATGGRITCPLDPTPNSRLWYYRWLGCDAVLAHDPAATIHKLGRNLA